MADWTPALLSGDTLKLWLAGNLNADQTEGAKATWTDASPGENTLVAVVNSTTNPALVANVLNSLPVFRFNNNNGFDLQSDFGVTGNRFTVFVVARVSSGTGTNDLWTSRIPNDSAFTFSYNDDFYMSSYDPNEGEWGQEHPLLYGSGTYTDWHMSAQVWMGRTGSYGALDGDATSNSIPYGSNNKHLADLTTGISIAWDRGVTGSGYWPNGYNGDMAEFIVINGAVTELARQVVEGYLADKYALPLVAGHPYESAAPQDTDITEETFLLVDEATGPRRSGMRYPIGAGLRQRTLR